MTNNFLRRAATATACFRDAALEAYDDGPPLEDVLAAHLSARGGVPP